MAVPEYQSFMLPILRALEDGEALRWQDLREPCMREFALTAEDAAEQLDSGGSRLDNRIHWATTYLAQAGLLERPRRGYVRIAPRGREVLSKKPDRVDNRLLSRFPEFQEFRGRTRGPRTDPGDANGVSLETTPAEAISLAVQENAEALASELLQRVHKQEPEFLERLVLRLLTAMGYGGRENAAEHLGRAHDGGIDGVIRQDALGLDLVYVQAKRYALDKSVGRPDMQAFVGALHGVGADRGVFITTGRFSAEARDYVTRIPSRIVLIDGPRLARLMIEYNVGAQDEQAFVLKRIDEDFFE